MGAFSVNLDVQGVAYHQEVGLFERLHSRFCWNIHHKIVNQVATLLEIQTDGRAVAAGRRWFVVMKPESHIVRPADGSE